MALPLQPGACHIDGTSRWTDLYPLSFNCRRYFFLVKNRTYHDGIKGPLYKAAMFGCDVKVSVASSCLPKEDGRSLETVEDLENFISDTHNRSINIIEDDDNNQEN